MQEIQAYSVDLTGKWGAYGELSFSIDKQYVDILTGEVKTHPAFDKMEGLRGVLVEGIGYFLIQDPNESYSDKDSKSLNCFSSEYACASKFLVNFKINNGDVDSAEYIQDQPYIEAIAGQYSAFEKYYIKSYNNDTESYVYEQYHVVDANAYATHFGDGSNAGMVLYTRNFPTIQFYNNDTSKQHLSLLHLVLEKIPEWKIGFVDPALYTLERTFDESRISVYDFLMNKVQDAFDCIVEWDTLNNTVNFYAEVEDGITEDNNIDQKWDTDIFVSKDNLANEIKVSYSTDNIKTRLKVSGGTDDLDIRDVNLGDNYIMDLSYYHNYDWMDQDVFDAYSNYLSTVQECTPLYQAAATNRIAAYNQRNDLMNAVPAEGGVLLVGDDFEKLYCVYEPYNDAYYPFETTHSIGDTLMTIYLDEDCTTEITPEENGTYTVQGYTYQYKQHQSITEEEIEEMRTLQEGGNVDLFDRQCIPTSKLIEGGFNEDVISDSMTTVYAMAIPVNQKAVVLSAVGPDGTVYNGVSLLVYALNLSYGYPDDYGLQIGPMFEGESAYEKAQIVANRINELQEKYYSNYKCIGASINTNVAAFTDKLNLYHVNKDVTGKASDNILLTLKNSSNDTVTIRIYDPHKPIGAYDSNIKYYCTKRTDEIYDRQNVTESTFDDYEQLYTNNYMIQVIIVRANSGLADTPQQYSLSDWVSGQLSATYMGLVDDEGNPNFKIQSIGIIGSYFALAKSETSEEVLEDYGVNLLRNKHKEYTQVFRTQTEAMFSYGGYQCVVQDDEPVGNIADGVRWLDTNSSPVTLKQYDADDQIWKTIDEEVSEEDRGNYENYQRYLDNFEKLVAVQTVLVRKEKEAEYQANGYKVESLSIDIKNYTKDDNGVLRDTNGETLQGHMRQAAINHFGVTNDNDIIETTMDQETPVYTFKYDGKNYIVYLNNNVPYVSYPQSVGYYQTKMDNLKQKVVLRDFFDDDQWEAISPFIREDEYSNSNLILTGYESDEERLSICNELLTEAKKELNKLCKPSLEFSMTMANIYALPEFQSLMSKFQLGNFIRVDIGNNITKRARLLEIRLNFDDLSDLSCTFGNLVSAQSEIDKHAELMAQAVEAGKVVADSSNSWDKATEVIDEIWQFITDGLQDAVIQVGKAAGQYIQIDENGIWGRAKKAGEAIWQQISNSGILPFAYDADAPATPENVYVANTATPMTEEWEDEQFRIINNKFVFTNDNWKTSKGVFGKYTLGGEERWGVLAEAVNAGLIESCEINGGIIKIGKQPDGTYAFEVSEDGTVTMGGGSKIGGVTIDEVNSALFNSPNTVVHTSKPEKYKIGDLWILAHGEVCGQFSAGSLLKAIRTSMDGSFDSSHWVDAIEDTTSIIKNVRESFTWNDAGVQVAKRITTATGEVSTPFYVQITSDRMGFHSQSKENGIIEDTEVVHIGNKSATIQNAVLDGANDTIVNNELEVRDDANFYGAVNIYNESRTNGFMWQTEENGSFSLVVL